MSELDLSQLGTQALISLKSNALPTEPTMAVAQWVRALAQHSEGLGDRVPASTYLSRKTGIGSSIAKRSAIGVFAGLVLGDDHYKRMSRVTVGVTRLRTALLNDHECQAQVKICSPSLVMVRSQLAAGLQLSGIFVVDRAGTYSATHSKNCTFIAQKKLRTVWTKFLHLFSL